MRFTFRRILIFSSLLLVIPILTSAHGNNFFEFNPDSWNTSSTNPATFNTVDEAFIPQNEFLGGVDLWLDNTGSAGELTIELRNENDVLVASRTVSVPTVAFVAGGKRFHVDFNSQVPVQSNKKYLLRIITTMPTLRLYYSDRINLLLHNAPQLSAYLNGAAVIDGEEKEFSFKFALYELLETSPPVISNVSTASVLPEVTKVSFNANEAVDAKVDYGLAGSGYTQSVGYSGAYIYCGAGISFCSVNLPTQTNVSYNYLLTVKDNWGNESRFAGSFNSGIGNQPTATPTPVVTNSGSPPIPTPSLTQTTEPLLISDFRITAVTSKNVEVAWHTNRASNSSLLIFFTNNIISIAAANDSTFELEHFLATNPVLNRSTTYFARIISHDSFDETASATLAFTTLKTDVVSPTPTPSPNSFPPAYPVPSATGGGSMIPTASSSYVVSLGGTAGFSVVQWNVSSAGAPANGYRIDIFDNNKNLVKQIKVANQNHTVKIENLPAGQYYAVAYADDGKALKKVSPPVNFSVQDTFVQRLLKLWPYMIPAFLGAILFAAKKLLKRKNTDVKPPVLPIAKAPGR